MPPRRLVVHGPNITTEDGTNVRLRGFNLLFMLDSSFDRPRDDVDGLLLKLLPGVNVVRLVMLHWDDRPTEMSGRGSGNDCSEVLGGIGNSIQISSRCLDQFDRVLRWTAERGLWAIITARASIAAGERLPDVGQAHGKAEDARLVKHTVFGNADLRQRFIDMWRVVARRYRDFDMIATYEILSEPRVQTWEVPPDDVRSFYASAISAIRAVDPRTPCMIGPAPFYSRSNLPLALQPRRADQQIIYTFNFFVPRAYVQQLDTALRYPGPMQCCDVFDKEHAKCCPDAQHGQDLSKLPCCATMLAVDRAALERQLLDPIRFGQANGVPVVLDQWGVQRGAAGRLRYLSDMLEVLEAHGLHWIYWQWRHRTDRPFAVVHMDDDASFKAPQVDVPFVSTFATVLGGINGDLQKYKDAVCYAQRYPELQKTHCDPLEPGICKVLILRQHFLDHGHSQGRHFECISPPLPPQAPGPSVPPPPQPPPSVPLPMLHPALPRSSLLPPPVLRPLPLPVTMTSLSLKPSLPSAVQPAASLQTSSLNKEIEPHAHRPSDESIQGADTVVSLSGSWNLQIPQEAWYLVLVSAALCLVVVIASRSFVLTHAPRRKAARRVVDRRQRRPSAPEGSNGGRASKRPVPKTTRHCTSVGGPRYQRVSV